MLRLATATLCALTAAGVVSAAQSGPVVESTLYTPTTFRVVITGRKDIAGNRIEVLQGLKADATVLAARFDNLREGALAEVTGSSSVAPAASASNPRPAS